MQPPPRKGNNVKFLKNLNAEQIVKLQAKNQHECDLLEDIRSYTIKRSAIERSYSEALLKISSAYLNKKIPNIPDIKTDGGAEQWNMWNVWRTVLEENEKLARARLAAIEVFSQNVADDAKHLKSTKLAAQRKAVDVLASVQKELQITVSDIDKTKKLYFDEEHCAHDVRDKAKDIEEKLKRKKGSFFQSITSLQKNSAKVSSRRDQLEEKSTGARNDYLLSLAAANAHQRRYFLVDLQHAMQTMENNVYDRVSEYLTLIGRTELLTCSATQTSFTRIRDQAQQLSRDYNLQCVYLYYPVLKQHIQYEFEPCDNDAIDKITAEHSSAAATLAKEAKRWATKIGREHNSANEHKRKLQTALALRDSGQKTDPNDPNNTDIEVRIDELRAAIRRAETSKMKAEARIECLRQGGINVDEYMQELDTLSVQDIPRSGSSLSVRTDASGAGEPPSSDSYYDSDNYDGPDTPKKGDDRPDSAASDEERQRHDSEVDAMLEQERQRIEQLTAGWDDPTTVDWGGEETQAETHSKPFNESNIPTVVYKCVALYSYTAQNPDELNMVESEQLEVVGEGDGDGWLRARNYRGEEGFVPQNYLDVDRSLASTQDYTVEGEVEGVQPTSEADWPAPSEPSEAAWAPENGETETANEAWQPQAEAEPAPWPPAEEAPAADGQAWTADFQTTQSGPDSTTSLEQEFVDDGFNYCIALYDYEATAPEELTFVENQVIKLLRKDPHGLDDGWWEGYLDGNTGLFPSLVVEECRPDGQPLTPEEEDSPPPSVPPAHTPPDVPSFLVTPQSVIVTQPTPIGDHPSSGNVPNGAIPAKDNRFEMSLTKGQQEQYQKQFDGKSRGGNIPIIMQEDADEVVAVTKPSSKSHPKSSKGSGLGVAEIVITAATPMHEEPETPFPPVPEEKEEDLIEEQELDKMAERESTEDDSISEAVTTVIPTRRSEDNDDNGTDDCPTDSAPFPISSSTGSEDDPSSGPSTAENSQSLPEELEPQALAKLKNLKESNA